MLRDLAPAETRRELDAKDVRAILIVVPLAEKNLMLLRGLLPQNPKTAPALIPIEASPAPLRRSSALMRELRYPKGHAAGVASGTESDDVTTLRASFYVVARKKLDNDLVGGLTEALMKARRDLLGVLPILGQMTAASTESDAYLPVHPGAAAFYNGTQQSFLDKWGNAIFLAPMIFGGIVSMLAAAWKFLRAGEARNGEPALDALYSLGNRIRNAEAGD